MPDYKAIIDEQVASKPVFIYMKGSPMMPQCGFSARSVEVLKAAGAEFGSFNIHDDMSLFEELKKRNQWPTSPQIYVKGEFIGGCDIVCEMFENGELQEMLK
ncbi:MAG: Grx4 family monothiol glutaredoxin [Proteobacteria bacterium]|nr:MAG: Grx4 family monothiol glutaredoxin [Pseudomonadota bacterium]